MKLLRKMNKKIFNTIAIILMIGLSLGIASALTVYSGETVYYDFTNEVDVIQSITWEVVNNTYNLDGLNITTNLTGAIMSIDPLFKPDNFTIIFTITGVNEQPVYRGGGTKYVDKIIEVPNYIDREVIKEIEKEIPSEPEIIKEVPEWVGFTFVVGLLIIFALLGYIWRIKNEQRIKGKRNK